MTTSLLLSGLLLVGTMGQTGMAKKKKAGEEKPETEPPRVDESHPYPVDVIWRVEDNDVLQLAVIKKKGAFVRRVRWLVGRERNWIRPVKSGVGETFEVRLHALGRPRTYWVGALIETPPPYGEISWGVWLVRHESGRTLIAAPLSGEVAQWQTDVRRGVVSRLSVAPGEA